MRSAPYFETWWTTPPSPVKRFCCMHRRFERPIYARSECPARASCMSCRLLRAPAQLIMRWHGRSGMREAGRQNELRSCAFLYNSMRVAAITAAAGEPMRKHAESPAKAFPDFAFIAPARRTIRFRVPRTPRANRCAEKCRIILVPLVMVVKKIYAGLEIAGSSE